jgi:hypothetical protein
MTIMLQQLDFYGDLEIIDGVILCVYAPPFDYKIKYIEKWEIRFLLKNYYTGVATFCWW